MAANLVLLRSDAELVEHARRGDRDAFGELAERYRPMCLRMAYNFVRHDAEDATQNALLEAFRNLHQFSGTAAFSTWLGRIVINECLMLLRTVRRHRAIPLAAIPRDRRPISRLPDPEAIYALRQLRGIVRLEVSRIYPAHRVALFRDLQEVTVADIARQLGITHACAKSRLFRARAELRIRIETRFKKTTIKTERKTNP